MRYFILPFLVFVFFLGNAFSNSSIETSPPLFEEEKRSQHLYLSGGLNTVLPTVSLGYQVKYGSLASDLSISGSFFPKSRGYFKFSGGVIPGATYKQLFFIGKSTQGKDVYLGGKMGFYPDFLGVSRYIGFGGVFGVQIPRGNGKDFFELGVSPMAYFPQNTKGNQLFIDPLFFSFSYGILF